MPGRILDLLPRQGSGEGLHRRQRPRRGLGWAAQLAMALALVLLVALLVVMVGDVRSWASDRVGQVLLLGALFATWRWSWAALHVVRAIVYRAWAYPRLRRRARRAVALHGGVPEVTVLVTTYHERPWITAAVIDSIFAELSTLEGLHRPPRVVAVTGGDADDRTIRRCASRSARQGVELLLLRNEQGKRPAIADGLRAIARRGMHPEGVVLLMDGDTVLQPGLLDRVLPFFRLEPAISALTTNEASLVCGPGWFAEWLSLRFGQRHLYMCSHSLSQRVQCLTGRLSAYRASVATDPAFRAQIEHDVIDHWLWGRYEMFSGDDKSTWYFVARRKGRMLYVPDAETVTLEVVPGTGVQRAVANLQRWSGNMLRNNWRAIALGPGRLGPFAWWSTVDQRLSTLTALIGPTATLLAIAGGHFELAAAYLLWVVVTRIGRAAVGWWHGRRFSAFYVPLQALGEWVGAGIKLWSCFHPVKQAWLNRGARTRDAGQGRLLRSGMAKSLYASLLAAFIVFVAVAGGFAPLLREAPLFLGGGAR